jgi:hypothetical protein
MDFVIADVKIPLAADVSMYIYASRAKKFYEDELAKAKRDGEDMLALHYESSARQMGRVLERGEDCYHVSPWARSAISGTIKAFRGLGFNTRWHVENILERGAADAREFVRDIAEAFALPHDVVE